MIPLTYSLEAFYNFKKRRQKLPLAQLVGRLDFTLFPIAGYLCFGHPDHTVLLFILFFYPLAEVHLGINDLADIRNDEARQLQTVGTMYGIKGTICWIQIFSGLHIITAAVFLLPKGIFTVIAFITGLLLLLIANLIISAQKTPEAGLKALPLLHATLAVYITGIIIQSAVNI
jgi:4-hydroxybenzoate polyprenyltransferase